MLCPLNVKKVSIVVARMVPNGVLLRTASNAFRLSPQNSTSMRKKRVDWCRIEETVATLPIAEAVLRRA